MGRTQRFVVVALLGGLVSSAPSAAQDRPLGFEQILPRGRIAAVDEPVYVSAAAARIPEGAWVLGVVIGGQALAYSVNLLNAHEVVNDEVNGQPFAAVW